MFPFDKYIKLSYTVIVPHFLKKINSYLIIKASNLFFLPFKRGLVLFFGIFVLFFGSIVAFTLNFILLKFEMMIKMSSKH